MRETIKIAAWLVLAVAAVALVYIGFLFIFGALHLHPHHGHPPATEPATPKAEVAPKTTRMRVTAYCACKKCCGRWADGITASGRPVTANGGKFVAAPRNIPFGTMIRIPGYHDEAVPVYDRGGSIKDNRLDVYFDAHEKALDWGVKMVEVTIGRAK